MDAYALRSQQAAAAAARARASSREEIVPVEVDRRAARRCAWRRTTTCAPTRRSRAWPRCKPAFGKDGFVTAGNASGIVDGAAALVVAARDEAQRRGLQPLASIVAWGVAGRAARDHGHRPGARLAQGAGGGRRCR